MMLLQVVMLSMVVHFGTGGVANTDPSLHLLGKIASGRFADIDLKSITYYNLHQVVIFEGDYKYFIPISDITQTSMKIPDTYLSWDDTELVPAIPTLNLYQGQSIKSVYFQCESCGETYFRAFINTGKYLYSLQLFKVRVHGLHADINIGVWVNKSIVKHKKQLQHGQRNFAIAHDQRANDDSVGYVIHKDINQATHNFVIYQLILQDWNVYLQDPSSHDSHFHQYHLERTDKPSQVKLVHSSRYEPNQPNSLNSEERNSLFNSQPRGFMLEGRLYLFDSALGCVYIIVNWGRFDLWDLHKKAEQDEVILKRVNVPYEQFFKPYGQEQKLSDNFRASYPADRCETTNRVDGGRPSGLDGNPGSGAVSNGVDKSNLTGGSGQIAQENNTGGFQWIIYLGAALVIAILIIALTIVFVRKRKQRSKKITNSSNTKVSADKKKKTPAHKQRTATPTKVNNSTPRSTSASSDAAATSTSVASSSSPASKIGPKKETPVLKPQNANKLDSVNSSVARPMNSTVTNVTKDMSDLLVVPKQQPKQDSSECTNQKTLVNSKLTSSSAALPMASSSSSKGSSGQSGTIRSGDSKASK